MSSGDLPTILIPYRQADCDGSCQDVFLYLRPETNGIQVESRIMRVLQEKQLYRDSIELVYLANFPGEFITRRRIVENHYQVRIYFAQQGGAAFTSSMRETFASYFGVESGDVPVLGAFQAMDKLKMSADQLFGLWVPQGDMIFLCGQSIKRYQDSFIVNYDIPAILSKNSVDTDIAVMILRTTLNYSEIHELIFSVGEALQKAGLLRRDMPLSRAFHYSKGPFEQILDAGGYVFDSAQRPVPLCTSSFFRYLQEEHAFSDREILMAMNQPIMRFCLGERRFVEDEIFAYTQDDSFEEAALKLESAVSQSLLPVKPRNLLVR